MVRTPQPPTTASTTMALNTKPSNSTPEPPNLSTVPDEDLERQFSELNKTILENQDTARQVEAELMQRDPKRLISFNRRKVWEHEVTLSGQIRHMHDVALEIRSLPLERFTEECKAKLHDAMATLRTLQTLEERRWSGYDAWTALLEALEEKGGKALALLAVATLDEEKVIFEGRTENLQMYFISSRHAVMSPVLKLLGDELEWRGLKRLPIVALAKSVWERCDDGQEEEKATRKS